MDLGQNPASSLRVEVAKHNTLHTSKDHTKIKPFKPNFECMKVFVLFNVYILHASVRLLYIGIVVYPLIHYFAAAAEFCNYLSKVQCTSDQCSYTLYACIFTILL